MLGLLHRSPIRCCAASARYPARKPCAETASGSNPATAQRRFDQIDRLRRERLFLHRFSAVEHPEDRPFLMSTRSSHLRSASPGGPTRSTLPFSSTSPVLVRPS
jgi:hypothetical protein